MAKKLITKAVFDFKTGTWTEESQPYDGEWAYAGMPGTFVQDSYAFYDDDAAIGSSTIIGSINNGQTLDVDTTYQVRFRLSETATQDDIFESASFEYELNTSGTWVDVSTSSSVIQATTSSYFTNGDDVTTGRLSGGTGSFFTGAAWATEDGDLPNLNFANGSEHTECVLAFTIPSGDVANNDSILLRMTGTPAINTYTNTASITVNEAGATRRIFVVS